MRHFLFLWCIGIAAGSAGAAEITATWLGGPGNYIGGSNWDTGVTPVNGSGNVYDVVVNTGSITLDLSPTINTFSLSNATLTVSGTGTRTITAATTFGTGAVIGGGILGLAGTTGLTATGTNLFLNLNGGAQITNTGTFTHTASGSGQTAIVFNANNNGSSVFDNAAAGVFDANPSGGDASLGYGGANSGNVFQNEGTFNKTGTHDYAANVTFKNTGTVNVQQGSLTLNAGDGGSTTGTYAVSSGATLAIGSSLVFASGGSVTGAGTMQLKSGSAEFDSGSVYSVSGLGILSGKVSFLSGASLGTTALTMSGGTLELDTDHSFNAASMAGGATIIGSGHAAFAGITNLGIGNLTFGGSGLKEFSGTAAFAAGSNDQFFNIDGGTEVRNTGSFTVARTSNGNAGIILNADSVGGTSVFRNAAGGTFTANMASGDGTVGFGGVATNVGNSFINEGSFIKTGSGAYTLNVAFNNSGTVAVQTGTLSANAGGSATGSFAISSGATLGLNGIQQFQGGSSITGAGTVIANGGTTTFQSGSSFSAAAFQLLTGTVNFQTGSTLGLTALTISNGATLNLNGPQLLPTGFSIGGSGTVIDNGGNITFQNGSSFSAANLQVLAGVMAFQSGSTLGSTALTLSGGTLEMDIDHSFNVYTFASGTTVSGSGATTFNATTNLDGKTLNIAGSGVKKFSGSTSFTAGATDSYLNVAGGAQLTNAGNFTQTRDASGQSQMVLNSDSAGGSSIFLNASGANFTAAMTAGDGGVGAASASTANRFINQGTFTKTGPHDYDVNVAFANSGSVNISQGNLALNAGDGGSTAGTFSVPSGSFLIVNGGFTFGTGSNVSGSGTFQSNGGTTAFNSGSSFNASALEVAGGTTSFGGTSSLNASTALTLAGGTLEMDIDHTFTSYTLASGTTISGSGATTFSATTNLDGKTLSIAGSGVKKFTGTTSFTAGATDSYLNIAGGAHLTNSGNFTQTRDASGQSQLVLNSDSAGGTSVFQNAASATFNAVMSGGDGGVGAGLANSANEFVNQGTFNKSGTHDYDVYVSFANSGTVNISQGNLALNGGDGGSTSGSFSVPSGSLLIVNGGFSFGTGATVSGSGTFESNGGTTAFNSGSSFNASTLEVAAGTTSFGGTSSLNTSTALTLAGGTLEMDIDHTFNSYALASGTTVSGSGATTFAAATNLDGKTLSIAGSGVKKFTGATSFTAGGTDSYLNIAGGAHLTNSGNFTQTRDASGQSQIVLNSDLAGGPSVFQNAVGATFNAVMSGGDGGVGAGSANSANEFINQGTFNKSGTHDYDVYVAFANSGTVNISQGNLALNGGDGGTTSGTFNVPSGSFLIVNGGFAFGNASAVSGSGTFESNGGTTAFNSGSLLSASNLDIAGGTTSFGAGSSLSASTALTITGGTLEMDTAHTFTNATISSGATLGGTAAITFSGTVALSSASIIVAGSGVKSFSGTTTFSPGATNSFLNIASGAEVMNTGSFTQNGSTAGASGIVLASDGTGPSTFVNTNRFTANIASGSTGTMGYAGPLNANNKFVNSSSFTKTGAGTYQINVAVTNSGVIAISQGTLSITAGITDAAGVVLIGSGTTLDLSQNANPSSITFLTHNGASLQLGANDLTIMSDYQNSAFGTGNSFNARANVSGTGKILARTHTSLAYGSDASSGSIQFGTIHIGDAATKNYTIENTGTFGVTVRGAIQTSVGGANIMDPRLSGAGLTAPNFDLTQSSTTNAGAVTFTATTPGPLTGQQLHVATNFDNVTLPNLAIQGVANYYADPLWADVSGNATLTELSATSYRLDFGTISLTSGVLTANLSLLNQLQDAIYQDALNGSFATGGVTHFSLTGFGAFSNIASGSSDGGFTITLNPSTTGNGTFADTLTLNPTSSNTSSTSPLSSIQINIQATVVPEPGALSLLLVGGILGAICQARSGRRAAGTGQRE